MLNQLERLQLSQILEQKALIWAKKKIQFKLTKSKLNKLMNSLKLLIENKTKEVSRHILALNCTTRECSHMDAQAIKKLL